MPHFSCFCPASRIIQMLSLSNWLKWVGEDTSHSPCNIQCSFTQANFSLLCLSIQKEAWNILWGIKYSAFFPDYIKQFPGIIDLQLTLKNQGWITSIKGRNSMKNLSVLCLCLTGQLFPVDSWLDFFMLSFGSPTIIGPGFPAVFLCMVLIMSFFLHMIISNRGKCVQWCQPWLQFQALQTRETLERTLRLAGKCSGLQRKALI